MNIIDLDVAAVRLGERLLANEPAHLYSDAMIAATAMIRGFSVVTRNIRDFDRWDVKVVNPFVS